MTILARAASEREAPMTIGHWHDFVARYFALAAALRRAIRIYTPANSLFNSSPWLSLRPSSPFSLPSIPPCAAAIRQAGRTHEPDRTQERDRHGRDAHHRSIRAHRGHCAHGRSPPPHTLPPSLIPPARALTPRATGRVRSGLAAFAGSA